MDSTNAKSTRFRTGSQVTHKKIGILISLLLASCAAVNTSDIEILSEAHPRFQLGGYGSYSWAGSASIVFDSEGRWEPPGYDLDAEIKFLIDTEMRALGLVENSANADLILGFGTVIDIQSPQLNQDPDSSLELLEQSMPLGALSVTFIDARTGFVVWVGIATADIEETPDPDLSRQRLQYVVTNMLNTLPE